MQSCKDLQGYQCCALALRVQGHSISSGDTWRGTMKFTTAGFPDLSKFWELLKFPTNSREFSVPGRSGGPARVPDWDLEGPVRGPGPAVAGPGTKRGGSQGAGPGGRSGRTPGKSRLSYLITSCLQKNHCSPPCNTDDASHVRQQPERKDTGPGGRQFAWRVLDFFKTALRACSHSRQVEVLARRA